MDTLEQMLDDKTLENEALQDFQEALPPIRTEDFLTAASSYKASRWLPSHSAVGLQHGHEWGKLWYSLQKWSNAVVGQFRPAPCLFILLPKNVTSETPISLLSALFSVGGGSG